MVKNLRQAINEYAPRPCPTIVFSHITHHMGLLFRLTLTLALAPRVTTKPGDVEPASPDIGSVRSSIFLPVSNVVRIYFTPFLARTPAAIRPMYKSTSHGEISESTLIAWIRGSTHYQEHCSTVPGRLLNFHEVDLGLTYSSEPS